MRLIMYAAIAAPVALASCLRHPPEPVPAPVDVALHPISCEALTTLALPHVTIREARTFPASAAKGDVPALPASCRVQGISRPTADSEIRFEVAIPVGDAWNGRYLQVGNGGFAGHVPDGDILEGLAKGFVTAGTDDGHTAKDPADARWALGHPEKVIDFGYRAIKETTHAARAIVRAHTGRSPTRSFFYGCSDGGREALMEAQRYPQDFDGIVAGAPANSFTRLMVGAAWDMQALFKNPGSYLRPGKLKALADATRAACGDSDGVVADPLACHFDPSVLRCRGAEDDRCLTEAEIATVRAIYAGPRNARTGETISPGFEAGMEAEPGAWRFWLVHPPGEEKEAALYAFAHNFFAYMVFGDPNYDIRRLDFDSDVATLVVKLGPILDATNPDLGPFRKHGGKLIQWHGWSDAAIPPRFSTGYFDAVQAKMGNTDEFYRLFMAPGVLHCGGGQGPDVFEALPALVDWVESGKAPERIRASKIAGAGPNARVVRSRPLCPYPQVAIWDRKGPRERAQSYACGSATGR